MNNGIFIAGGALLLGLPGLIAGASTASAGFAGTPAAHMRVAKFAIANMTCATCPITVKKAMQRVTGVRSVSVDFGSKTATVAFDPTKANLTVIAAASTNAGFPAKSVR